MKTKSHSKITFSQAVNGYLLAAQSRHLSQHTIDEYLNTFRKFQTSLDDDPPLITLSPADVQAFLAAQTVSKKTILNYHIGLSALWTWAVNEGLAEQHILHQVERAKPEKRTIPFCAPTGQALWRYLTTPKDASAGEALFSTSNHGSLERYDLREPMFRIGQRGGVRDVTVHRFRHTFAISYLRNGGDLYSLQMMLGHSTVDHWRL